MKKPMVLVTISKNSILIEILFRIKPIHDFLFTKKGPKFKNPIPLYVEQKKSMMKYLSFDFN
jgi:hypothetical protein